MRRTYRHSIGTRVLSLTPIDLARPSPVEIHSVRAFRCFGNGLAIACRNNIAVLIAVTRPDGALYFVAYPAALRVLAVARAPRFRVRWIHQLAIYAASIVVTWGGHLLFRWRTFGQLVPNTYYSKGGPTKDRPSR